MWTLLLPQSGSPTSTLVVGEPDYPSPPINNHIVLQIACRANWASFAKTLIILQKHRTLCTHFTLCKNIAHFAKHCIFCTQHTTLTCTPFANTFLICCWHATLPPLICLLAIYKIFKGFNIHTQKAYIIALILQTLLSCMSEHKHTDTDTKKHSKHMLFIFQAIFLMFLVLVPLISFEHLTACNEAWENLFSSLNLLK